MQELDTEMADAIQAILNAKSRAIQHSVDGFFVESLDIAEKVIRLAQRYGHEEGRRLKRTGR